MKFVLKKKNHLQSDIWQFVFEKPTNFSYQAGQYMQFSLPDEQADERGTKRWFTLSSSPSESDLCITTRIVEKHSSFKNDLNKMAVGDSIGVNGPEGDFTLPPTGKLLWIAGGIGVTPFRSQTKYLVDKAENRDIVLLHGNNSPADIAYRELFELANSKITSFCYVPVVQNFSSTVWTGRIGRIDSALVEQVAPDLSEREIYVSGPEPMVDAIKSQLITIGVEEIKIHQDWFPGYVDEFSRSTPA